MCVPSVKLKQKWQQKVKFLLGITGKLLFGGGNEPSALLWGIKIWQKEVRHEFSQVGLNKFLASGGTPLILGKPCLGKTYEIMANV